MPGLLGDFNQAFRQGLQGYNSGGVLGDFNQSFVGGMADQERQEYERAKAQGYTGTFEEWKAQKKQQGGMGFAGMMNNLTPGGPMSGIGVLQNALNGMGGGFAGLLGRGY